MSDEVKEEKLEVKDEKLEVKDEKLELSKDIQAERHDPTVEVEESNLTSEYNNQELEEPDEENSATTSKKEETNFNQSSTWGSWFNSASKAISTSVAKARHAAKEIVTEDVKEFSSQIAEDTSYFFKNKMTSIKEFASNYIFDDEKEPNSPPNFSTVPLPQEYEKFSQRLISELIALRNDTNTYTEIPSQKQFQDFCFDSYEVLDWTNDAVVQWKQKEVVPHIVSEEDFWRRYLFKIHLLKQKEALICNVASNVHEEEDFSWDLEWHNTPKKENKNIIECDEESRDKDNDSCEGSKEGEDTCIQESTTIRQCEHKDVESIEVVAKTSDADHSPSKPESDEDYTICKENSRKEENGYVKID